MPPSETEPTKRSANGTPTIAQENRSSVSSAPREKPNATGDDDMDPFKLDESLWSPNKKFSRVSFDIGGEIRPATSPDSTYTSLRRSSFLAEYIGSAHTNQHNIQQMAPSPSWLTNNGPVSSLGPPPVSGTSNSIWGSGTPQASLGSINESPDEYNYYNYRNLSENSGDQNGHNLQVFPRRSFPESVSQTLVNDHIRRHSDTQFPQPHFQSQQPSQSNTQASLAAAYTYFVRDVYSRVHITGDAKSMDLTTLLEDSSPSSRKMSKHELYLTLPKFPSPASASSGSSPSKTAGNNTSAPSQMILVGFKAGRVDVFHVPAGFNGSENLIATNTNGGVEESTRSELKLGDLVVVEADRGKDLGKLVRLNVTIDEARVLKLRQNQEQQAALAVENEGVSPEAHQQPSAPPVLHYPKPIIRFAQRPEILQLLSKQADEIKAKRICQLKVHQHNLSMSIIDAEYQWDRRKLTFYYQAIHRIDFRDLVRELFRIYKTRIWMCAVTEYDTSVDLVNGDTEISVPSEEPDISFRRGSKSSWNAPLATQMTQKGVFNRTNSNQNVAILSSNNNSNDVTRKNAKYEPWSYSAPNIGIQFSPSDRGYPPFPSCENSHQNFQYSQGVQVGAYANRSGPINAYSGYLDPPQQAQILDYGNQSLPPFQSQLPLSQNFPPQVSMQQFHQQPPAQFADLSRYGMIQQYQQDQFHNSGQRVVSAPDSFWPGFPPSNDTPRAFPSPPERGSAGYVDRDVNMVIDDREVSPQYLNPRNIPSLGLNVDKK